MRFPFALALLVALPLLEIATFVAVGREIGVLATVGLVLLSAVAGSFMLRLQGFGLLRRIQAEMEAGGVPQREVAHGAMIVVAGFLLLVPGFITDVFGILLFIPPFRDLVWSFLRSRVRVSVDARGPTMRPGGRQPQSRTIDLDEGDYSRGSTGNSPWKRPDTDE